MKIFFIVFVILPLAIHSQNQDYNYSAHEITKIMIETSKEIKNLSFDLIKTERFQNDYIIDTLSTKLMYYPFSVYTKKREGERNLELLFVKGENNNKCLINPDGFPWFNLHLDPDGVFMRRKQHNSINRIGHKWALMTLENTMNKYGDKVKSLIKILDVKLINNRKCWLIEFNNIHYKKIKYTVKSHENITDIANEHLICDYKILELNPSIDNYNDVEEGQEIVIPNDYCSKLIIAVDITGFQDRRLQILSVMKSDIATVSKNLKKENPVKQTSMGEGGIELF